MCNRVREWPKPFNFRILFFSFNKTVLMKESCHTPFCFLRFDPHFNLSYDVCYTLFFLRTKFIRTMSLTFLIKLRTILQLKCSQEADCSYFEELVIRLTMKLLKNNTLEFAFFLKRIFCYFPTIKYIYKYIYLTKR